MSAEVIAMVLTGLGTGIGVLVGVERMVESVRRASHETRLDPWPDDEADRDRRGRPRDRRRRRLAGRRGTGLRFLLTVGAVGLAAAPAAGQSFRAVLEHVEAADLNGSAWGRFCVEQGTFVVVVERPAAEEKAASALVWLEGTSIAFGPGVVVRVEPEVEGRGAAVRLAAVVGRARDVFRIVGRTRSPSRVPSAGRVPRASVMAQRFDDQLSVGFWVSTEA